MEYSGTKLAPKTSVLVSLCISVSHLQAVGTGGGRHLLPGRSCYVSEQPPRYLPLWMGLWVGVGCTELGCAAT